MAEKHGNHMSVPNTTTCIYPGDSCTVPKLGVGTFTAWYGWYIPEWSKPVFGWFLIDSSNNVHSLKFEYFDGIAVV